LSETGFRFVESKGNVELRIDYPLATQLALEHMSAIRNAILTASHAHTGSDREQVEVLAAFVQSMNLFEPPATRTSSAGTILYTAKSTHPVETLVLGGGDCDSLTLLFESLVRAGSSVDLAYLGTIIQGQRHLFAGVGVPPEEGDLIVGVGDSMLVVYELTSRNSSKLLSDSSRKALLSSDVEVFLVGPSRLSSSTER
jgi:hypothetical protein